MKNNFTEINEGGLHEENKLGGVPMGVGQNGQLNTVEEGETKKDNFIYSDRITLTPQVIAQFNLPKSLTGKTVADATKVINNKFEGRNSKIDNSTKKAFLDRIAEAQETVKQIEAQKQAEIAEALNMNSTMAPEDQMGGEIPQGMEEFLPQEQMMYGGKLKQNQMFFGGLFGGSTGEGSEGGSSGMGNLGGMFSGIGNGLNARAQQRDASKMPEGYVDEKGQQDQMNNQLIDSTKDTVSQAFGPIGGLFRGIQKTGQGIGNTIGGDAGAAVSGLFSPEEGMMSALTDKDLSIGQKALATIPGVGGVIAKRQADKRLNKFRFEKDTLEANSKISNFAFGGDMSDLEKKILSNIATKKDTMFVQKYSQDKKKDLLSKGYVKQQGFKRDEGYKDVHKSNDDALKMLQNDWENKKRRDIVNLKNERLSKSFDPAFYQKSHETNPNIYYNLEGANALGVINPNANYLAFDRRIDPNLKSNWINPQTGDGVELYEYDFGSKYNPPAPKNNKAKTSGKVPTVSQTKKISANPNVSKKPVVTPNQISPVSSGYKFAMGGNMYEGGGPFSKSGGVGMYDPTAIKLGEPTQSSEFLNNFNYAKNRALDPSLVSISDSELSNPTNGYSNPELAPTYKTRPQSNFGKNLGETAGKVGKFAKDNYGNALRYAPVAMNAYQLHKLNKEGYDTVNPILNNTRYNPEYMDEKALTNQINAESNYAGSALANSTNGSLGSLRNNILGSQLNKTKALSDAYSKVADANRGQNAAAQQFNLGVDEANIARRVSAEDKTAMNKGAFNTEKSKLQAQIGNDLGNIGKEQVYKKLAKEAFGYTYDGTYVKDKQGNIVKDPTTGEPLTQEQLNELQGKSGKDYKKVFSSLNQTFEPINYKNK